MVKKTDDKDMNKDKKKGEQLDLINVAPKNAKQSSRRQSCIKDSCDNAWPS